MPTPMRVLAALSVSLIAAGCGKPDGPTATTSPQPAAPATSVKPTEQASPTPRLALSYDGGVLVLDAETLRQVADIPVEGFVRLNSAANGRHVLVSQSDGFAVLDLGTWTDRHGDHGHHYTAPPKLTDIRFGGAEPGHVVAHDAMLTLFSDGTGAVDVVDPAKLLKGDTAARSVTVTTPHHGVAVARADGTTVLSVGDEETRSGAVILDGTGVPVATNEKCPGLHGEAAAAGGALTFGCQDGILIVRGNDIRKVASPDPYGRIGNQAGSDASPVVLGDYKTDPDAELERPRRFTLTDTTTGALRVVPIDASYSFRSLDRGPAGEAVILGTDGHLHVFDPVTAQRTAHLPAIGAWAEPDAWQSPMPNLHIQDGIAYVSDPDARRLVAVNLADGAIVAQTQVAHPTVELTGVAG
ncbi:zinc metallochaperone AztD [Mycolicibacterium sp. 120266]|uniref:zinc metallochaperone AztD n=1 Tax=Mycolicibacterium sp. 120266 TaxID=3090601 RepID=UPI00299F00B6|nr:zinc metallochaperone AztD [Mycolicibacterium sp. 120266]MDX1875858.1 zinc metallochaperone AztD [Mycolicibacterium sp. 120266]